MILKINIWIIIGIIGGILFLVAVIVIVLLVLITISSVLYFSNALYKTRVDGTSGTIVASPKIGIVSENNYNESGDEYAGTPTTHIEILDNINKIIDVPKNNYKLNDSNEIYFLSILENEKSNPFNFSNEEENPFFMQSINDEEKNSSEIKNNEEFRIHKSRSSCSASKSGGLPIQRRPHSRPN